MSTDLHTLSGAYAIDALSEEEARQFDRHLEECPSCREESLFVAKLAKEKKTLAEIRAAVDKEFG
mgnify:CR=1 FL=1